MSQPFNLDAVVGEDDLGTPFPFSWGGQEFSMPSLLSFPIQRQIEIVDRLKAAADSDDPGEILHLLQAVAGEALLDDLSAVKPLSSIALMRLLGGWMRHQGLAPGKSPDSSESSEPTAPPSKATSRSGRVNGTS